MDNKWRVEVEVRRIAGILGEPRSSGRHRLSVDEQRKLLRELAALEVVPIECEFPINESALIHFETIAKSQFEAQITADTITTKLEQALEKRQLRVARMSVKQQL